MENFRRLFIFNRTLKLDRQARGGCVADLPKKLKMKKKSYFDPNPWGGRG